MSERMGATITCDRWITGRVRGDGHHCESQTIAPTLEEARAGARERGWTRENERDYCSSCSQIRAARKRPCELVPAGVRVMRVFDAAEAAGFERRDYNEETGVAHFYCCDREVEVNHILGDPYGVRCNVCGTAIASFPGPSFGNAWVSFPDDDKIVTEDPERWVIVAEYNAAATPAPTGATTEG